jgi:translocation and assembly module TamB
MKIRGIRYKSSDSFFSMDEIALDWKPSRLILLEAHISSLKAEGVNIVAAEQTREAEPAADVPEISVPLKIVLTKAVFRNISIMQGGEQESFNIHKVLLTGHMGPKTIVVNQLDMEMPELALTAKGSVSPRGDYPMSFTTSWKVRVPEYEEIWGQGDIKGTINLLTIKQEITSPFYGSAMMKISDVLKKLSWEGNLSVREFNTIKLNRTWPGLTLSGAVLGSGSETNATISSLAVRISDGKVTGKGSVSWAPDISWSLNVIAAGLNPGIQWPEWQGSMDMTVHSSGHYEKGVLTVKPSEVFAEGRVRERPIKADARLSVTGSHLELSGMEVSSGESNLSASGSVADAWSVTWKAQIRDAGDLMPALKGVIEGSGSVTGSRSYPVIKGTISGRAVSYDNDGAESIKAVVDIDTKDERESLLDIRGANVVIGGQKISTVSLKGSGRGSAHSISMDATVDSKRVALSITGGYKDEVWNGKLNSAVLDTGTVGTWSLREPASLSVSADKAGSGLLCLVRNASDLCLQTSWDRNKGVQGKVSLADFPLSTLKTVLPLPVEADGSISGGGELSYTPEGMISGNVLLHMPSGKLYYRMDDEPVDISVGKSHADIILDESGLDVHAEILFSDRGHIRGGINLPGFMPGRTAAADQRIIGHVAAELNNLDLIPVFVEKLHKTSGSAGAEIRIHGTLAEIALTGNMTVQEGSADIPDLGLQLRDITLTLKGDERGTVTVEGRLSSGSGHSAIHGTAELHKEKAPSIVLRFQGEDFEAVKIPSTWIMASPDVDVRIEDRMIDFAGSLKIPQARVEPPDLSGAVLPSKDVIIIDMPVSEKEAGWSVRAKLKLSLGDNVRFSGYGLTCRITGGMDLTEQPGKITQGRGEFQIVEGKYKAYGQDLTIEKGRLIFIGLIDDPGLDIKAFRKIKDVTAGVNVQGTLKTPTIHVYSVPSMDESDALSYLLFGRPMKQLSGSEGNTLYGAALSAGLSAGGFVAKKIGAAFGVEDIEIEKGEAPEQATLFIGKYLSPRLYINYGIGLFNPVSTILLRYDLTRRLQVQTEYGLESGGDVLYTIER